MAVMPKVVVIGAGFGGLEVARHLKGAPVEVTLVDRHNFHTFQPLLYQVATAGLNAADVAHVVRGLFHHQANVRFRQGQRHRGRLGRRAGSCSADGPSLPFDHLVVAAGATVTYFGTPGAAEHGFPLYTLADATRLRNHIVRRFEAADTDPVELDRRRAHLRGGGRRGRRASRRRARWPSCSRWCSGRTTPDSTSAGRASSWSRCRTTSCTRSRRRADATRSTRCAPRRRGATRRQGRVGRRPTRVTFADGEVAPVPDARVGGRRARQPAGRHDRRWPRTAAVACVVGPTCGCPIAPGRGRSATWRRRGDRRRRAAAAARAGGDAGRPPRRPPDRAASSRAGRPSRSATATRGRWPPSADGPRSPSSRPASGCGAPRPGWRGWASTSCSSWASATALSVLLNWAWNYLTWDRGPRLILDGSSAGIRPLGGREAPQNLAEFRHDR